MLIKDKKLNLVNLALMIYVFSIIVFNEGTTVLKVVRVFFAGIMIIHLAKNKKIYLNQFGSWMIVFWMLCITSLKWTINVQNTKNMILTLTYNLICNFFVLNLLCEDKNRIVLVIKTIIYSSIILFGRIAITQGIFVYANGIRGGKNGLESANTVGTIAAVAIILGIYCLKDKKCKYPTIYYISIIANILIVILSASRKAILYALIPILIYYIANSKNVVKVLKNIILTVSIAIIAYLAIMKIPVIYNIVGVRFETMINGLIGKGETDASTALRMKMIEWGLEWFEERPELGYGIDSYRALLGKKGTSFGATGAYAHNNYIELLVDVGIVGVIVYYYIYVYIIKESIENIKKQKMLSIYMMGILIACIINEYGQVVYYSKFYQLLLVVVYIAIKTEKGSRNDE